MRQERHIWPLGHNFFSKCELKNGNKYLKNTRKYIWNKSNKREILNIGFLRTSFHKGRK